MVFSSLEFLLGFLPCLLVIYFIIPAKVRWLRNLVLLAFSLFFYQWGADQLVLLMVASILVNYLGGLMAGRRDHPVLAKFGVWFAAVLGLGLLGWFKYAGFLAQTVCDLGFAIPVPHITLPIGISFFTFQGLSYVIDVYRGDAPTQKNPLDVALYVALFPQLVAGPIVRYTTVMEDITHRRETLDEFAAGVTRFCFGLAKKMVIANAMGQIADGVFNQTAANLDPGLARVGALAYTFQIYFDFSAYSDMAIGLGRMFGFHFLENFNYPYISKSVTEFWRRWHISLSTWFRDYVYIPLGGNRCVKWKHVRNITVVWLLTGLWHGAAWTFILWGVWFCLLLLGEKFLWGGVLNKTPALVRHGYTMLAVVISWVLFRSVDLPQAWAYLGAMFGQTTGLAQDGQAAYYLLEYWPEWLLAIVASLPVKGWLQEKLKQGGNLGQTILIWAPKGLALGLLGLSYLKLVTSSFNPFIYFQF